MVICCPDSPFHPQACKEFHAVLEHSMGLEPPGSFHLPVDCAVAARPAKADRTLDVLDDLVIGRIDGKEFALVITP